MEETLMNTSPKAQFDTSDCMRTVRFFPYRKGMGPIFTLRLYYLGGERIGYTLTMREHRKTVTVFAGSDFRPSPMHTVDGDDAVKSLMGFLTLRPGDTDEDYFDSYTPVQLEYCSAHAEALSGEVESRFGE
jgi:hypothetical protein